MWRDRQIVSATWIEQSTTPQINGEGPFFYGYQWWLGRSLVDRHEVNWVAGLGWGGQALFVVPDLNIVVVLMAGRYNIPLRVVDSIVLNHYVLPAVVR